MDGPPFATSTAKSHPEGFKKGPCNIYARRAHFSLFNKNPSKQRYKLKDNPYFPPLFAANIPIPQLHAAKTQLQVANPQHQAAKPQPKLQSSEPQLSTPKLKVRTSEPKVPTSELQVRTSKQKVPASEPKVKTSELKVRTSELQVRTPEEKVPTSEPKVRTSQLKVRTSELKVKTPKPKVPTSPYHTHPVGAMPPCSPPMRPTPKHFHLHPTPGAPFPHRQTSTP